MLHLRKILSCDASSNRNTVKRCFNTLRENVSEQHEIESKYSAKHQKVILKTSNDCDEKELRMYGIPDFNIKILKSFQSEHNKPKSIDQIVGKNILPVSELPNISSLTSSQESKTVKPEKSNVKKSIVYPPIKKKQKEKINTAVGLRIKPTHISWCHLDISGSDCDLLAWECERLLEIPVNAKMSETLETGLRIADDIPIADAYVMEKDKSRSKTMSNSMFQYLIRQQQILSIILTALTLKRDSSDSDSFLDLLYTLKPFASAQLFGLFLGNETVSSYNVVQALIQKQDVGLKNISSLSISNTMENHFNSLDTFTQEELSQALLMTLTFFELAVLNRH